MKREQVKLPSGAILHIQVASFDVSKSLYQLVLEELKSVGLSGDMEMAEVYKNLFCVGFASKKIEAALWDCFKVCTLDSGKGELKIDKDSFEDPEARGDYWTVCIEVAKANILPFAKSLYADYGEILKMLINIPT